MKGEQAKFLIDLLKTERILLDKYPSLNLKFGREIINSLVILTNEHSLMIKLLNGKEEIEITPQPDFQLGPYHYSFINPINSLKIEIRPFILGNFITNIFFFAIESTVEQEKFKIKVNTLELTYSPNYKLYFSPQYVFPEKIEIEYSDIQTLTYVKILRADCIIPI
jgi:hypothetical protein